MPTEQQFLEGEPVNYAGLLFVLDPHDEALIHVAVPLDEFDPSEIPEMVKEARDIFIDFVSERPSLKAIVIRRCLLIRIVTSYDRFDEEVGQRVRIDDWREDVGSLSADGGTR